MPEMLMQRYKRTPQGRLMHACMQQHVDPYRIQMHHCMGPQYMESHYQQQGHPFARVWRPWSHVEPVFLSLTSRACCTCTRDAHAA